ncbi:hypothetical protein HDU96_004356 [Phlyctochytrium bullatum]|nr:hypothetical protein HDU96_004356 [Phlyctochytrium bullatum]
MNLFAIPQEVFDAAFSYVKINDDLATAVLSDAPGEVSVQAEADSRSLKGKVSSESDTNLNGSLSCNGCGVVFETVDEQRTHFRSDWHRYNQKQLVLGRPTITEADFDDREELSSIEASDPESEDEVNEDVDGSANTKAALAKGTPYYLFGLKSDKPTTSDPATGVHAEKAQMQALRIYKHIFGKNASDSKKTGVLLEDLKSMQKTVITRRDAEKSKQNVDKAEDGRPKPTPQPTAEIKELLTQWKSYFDSASLIFTRVPARSRRIVFFDDSLISGKDERIRSIPFSTRRPTLLELKRCFKELTLVKMIDLEEAPKDVSPKKGADRSREASASKASEKVKNSVDELDKSKSEPVVDQTSLKLIEMVKRGRVEALKTFAESPGFVPSVLNIPLPHSLGTSLLHLAASNSHEAIVALLLSLGADPTVTEESGKKRTPYEVTDDKGCRDAFRRAFAASPTQWEWIEKAKVPSPLTPEMEERQREKEREKRRKQKEKQKQYKESAAAQEQARLIQEEEERKKAEEEKIKEKQKQDFEKAKKAGVIGKLGQREKESMGITPEMRARIDREKRFVQS